MDKKKSVCLIGKSDFRDFTPWWESYLPSYLIVYCEQGSAELSIHFKPQHFSEGMMAIISYDMFPSFSDMTEDFRAAYCLFDRDFGDSVMYMIPSDFFDMYYWHPIAKISADMRKWIDILLITGEGGAVPFRKELLHNILQSIFLRSYDVWQKEYGALKPGVKRKRLEEICTRFYNLVFDNFKEHRDTQFYANALCISANYLAIVLRRVAQENPKEVIDRQVTLEIKYMLTNRVMTIAEIASELNFPDTSYLCRFFRRNTGMTISEFRTLHAGVPD